MVSVTLERFTSKIPNLKQRWFDVYFLFLHFLAERLLLVKKKIKARNFGFLGCECKWLGHIHPLIQQHPQVLLSRAALHLFNPQPGLVPGVVQTQVQHLALHLVKMDPLTEFVQVTVSTVTYINTKNISTRFVTAIRKLLENAFKKLAITPFKNKGYFFSNCKNKKCVLLLL